LHDVGETTVLEVIIGKREFPRRGRVRLQDRAIAPQDKDAVICPGKERLKESGVM
jgi:ABC-type molybdate transport system ATPase subunit